MQVRRDPYVQIGLGSLVAGGILMPVGYWVLHSAPYSAFGMSLLLLAAICLTVSKARPPIPPALSHILLETGLENVSALVEELGLRSPAIYLPSSLAGGSPQALIPLSSNGAQPSIVGPLPRRLVVKYGPGPEDLGLLMTTPGSRSLELLSDHLAPTVADLEAALTSIMVGITELATSVRVWQADSKLNVEVAGVRLSYKYEQAWLYQSLGSPVASIAAAVAAEVLGCPVSVEAESVEKSKSTVILALLK